MLTIIGTDSTAVRAMDGKHLTLSLIFIHRTTNQDLRDNENHNPIRRQLAFYEIKECNLTGVLARQGIKICLDND